MYSVTELIVNHRALLLHVNGRTYSQLPGVGHVISHNPCNQRVRDVPPAPCGVRGFDVVSVHDQVLVENVDRFIKI